GIRDLIVTGVQTCALPISTPAPRTRRCSPPPCGRAIACGQFSANGRNIGIEIGSCAQLWNPAALSHARFESKISTCDCPAPCGEGLGVGVGVAGRLSVQKQPPPSPPLPHKGGGSRPSALQVL